MGIRKLRKLNKVKAVVSKFTASYGIKAYINKDFVALVNERKVGYTLAPNKEDVEFFIEDAKLRFPTINADPFIWLLLHEIGHIMTAGMWTQEELEYFEERKEESIPYIQNDQYRNDYYHCCPDEFFATRWAGMEMLTHKAKIAKFAKELGKVVREFYAANNIEID